MMIEKFINALGKKGIFLSFVNNELKVKGDQAALTPEIIREIKSRKPELLDFFSNFNQQAKIDHIPKAPGLGRYPLTSAQKRLYFLYEYDPQATAYNMPYVLSLKGHLDLTKLQNSFTKLIDRHESLRTRFVKEDEIAFQQVVTSEEIEFQIQLLETDADHQEVIRAFICPFDLSRAPLFRVGALRIADDEYLLLTDWHHIITDGASQAILIKDFMECYQGQQLEQLDIHYKDYAAWAGKEGWKKTLKDYWNSVFEDSVEAIELPVDHPRSASAERAGEAHTQVLDQSTTKALKDLSTKNGGTLFMTILALLNVLLCKLTNQKDLVIGTPVAGRDHPDTQKLIGLFINTLALRNFQEPGSSFVQFLTEVKNKTLRAFEHSQYPFEELIENLRLARTTHRNPLFDVMFTLQNFEEQELKLPELSIKPYQLEDQSAKFDLSITANEQKDKLVISWDYDAGLFKAETIERFAQYFEVLIQQVLENRNQQLKELQILTKESKQQLLSFNDTIEDYPLEQTVVELFQEQAKRTPNKEAIVFREEQLTYRGLDKKSEELATTLVEKGVKPEEIIGVLLEQSVDIFIAILAIQKAGAAFLPIDPDLPDDRIAFILEDSRARMVISSAENSIKIDQTTHQFLDIKDQIFYSRQTTGLSFPGGNNLAYVIYTSGTTGTPKGTLIEHISLTNLCHWFNETYEVSEWDNTTKLAGLGFDATIFEIFPPLLKGATIHLFDKEDRLSPTRLNDYFNANEISFSFLPTPLCEQFLYLKNDSLRVLLTGGDKLNHSAHSNTYKLYNNYGPTETTVVASSFLVHGEYINIPIGRPIANTQAFVLNEDLKRQPLGVIGELYIGGAQLARGYLNQPELTKAKFIDNPFKAGERLYKTGDRVRWLADGNIEFLGRNDDQVKVRGFRIEPGEIESQLLKHSEVASAVVLAHEQGQEKQLVAYYTAAEQTTDSDLKSHLLDLLPDYMVPAIFMKLEELPLNRNGKVDRKTLPEPDFGPARAYEAPENETEEQLLEIWHEVLQIPREQISTTSNFFELGGHSLKATMVVNQLLKTLGVDIPVKDLFVYQNIRQLAAYIQNQGQTDFEALPAAPKQDNYPLTSAQKRLYFLYEFDSHSTAYNMPYVLSLKGKVDAQKLEGTFTQLVKRHESLRTRFIKEGETAYQQIVATEDVQFSISQVVLTEEASAEHYIQSFVQPFDLSTAPLFRIVLLKITDEEHLLLTDWHHIITDGTSQAILIQDFMDLYGEKPLAPLNIHYKDYADWRNQQSELDYRQKAYWLNQFAGEIPSLNLPGELALSRENLNQGDVLLFELSPDESQNIYGFLQEQKGITLFSFLLASFQVLLGRLTDQADVIVGSPVVNRSHVDTEKIIGLFLNTLPFRSYPERNKTFSAFLREVQSTTLEAFENQEYQFEDLISELNLERDLYRNPLFDVFFNLLNFEDDLTIKLDDLTVETVESDLKPEAKFHLTLYAKEASGQILFSCLYKSGYFQRASIQYIFDEFKKLLGLVIHEPDKLLEDYPVFSAKTIGLEADPMPIPKKKMVPISAAEIQQSLVDRFQAVVASFADRLALQNENDQINYRDLDLHSNRVANKLFSISSDQNVPRTALLFSHNLSMMEGILGALKAGHVYVPINIDQPLERMITIIQDAQASVLLTETVHVSIAEQVAGKVGIDLQIINLQQISEDTSIAHPNLQIQPDDLAYILYTSGSTGTPKGVMQTHRNVLHFWRVYSNALRIDHEDVLTMLSNYGHDAAVMSFFGTLLNGATGMLYDIKKRGLEGLHQELIDNQVTIYHSTPSVFRAFTSVLSEKASETIRLVVMGGEATLPNDVDRFKRLFHDDCLMINGLGSTEASLQSMYFMDASTKSGKSYIPVGQPFEDSSVYILKEDHSLADIYQEGMLVYESEFITPGYWRDPKKTEEKIKTGIFEPNMRYYFSGDLARRLPNDQIEFLGRNDDQIKLRGFRVALGEVEHQLTNHPQVQSAVVVAHEKESDTKLVAYYSGAGNINVQDLKNYLVDKLPDYMIPAIFMELEALPLTRNGKVDRKALPQPEFANSETFIAPANETEEKLVEIWSEVLQFPKEQISTSSNFFQLGGHSLKATLVVNQILRKLKVEVPLKDLFLHQDIQRLAAYVQTRAEAVFQHIPVAPEQLNYPLTAAQRRLYFLYEFDRQSTAYNMPYVLSVKGELDINRLEEAFTKLIHRHESLRTRFVKEGEYAFQQIVAPGEIHFQIQWLDTTMADNHEEMIGGFTVPFDLSQAPLFRVGIFQVSEEEYLLLTDLHHIITDGTSQAILIKDFIAIYEHKSLVPLNIHYKDYAYWKAQQQDRTDRQKTYWIERFSGEIPVLNLPGDFVLQEANLTRGDLYLFDLSKAESEGIRQFIKEQQGVTLFSFLLASFQVLLSRLANQEDIIVGSPVVNRSHADTEELIGLFLNTLPFRNHPKRDKPFIQFLQEVQQGALTAFENQEYQFEDLISELNLKRDLKRNPLFDVFFNLLNFDDDFSLELDEIKVEAQMFDLKPDAKFYLTLYAKEVDQQLLFSCLYKSAFFQDSTIRHIFNEFKNLLGQVILDPNVHIGDFKVFSHEGVDLETIQPVPNKPFKKIEVGKIEQTLIDRFQSIASIYPDRIALKERHQSITYRELNLKIQGVASEISAKDPARDDFAPRAALLFDHNIAMMSGLFGALRAGYAYVPITVDQPVERMLYMVRDAQAQIIVTERAHVATAKQVVAQTDHNIWIINVDDLKVQDSISLPENQTSPNDLAYILYTSGSTGTPKGVMQTHRNALHFWRVYTNSLHIDQEDVLTMLSNYGHDAAMMSFFGTLLNGAAGVLFDLKKEGLGLLEASMRENEVTIYHSTPSVFRAVTSTFSGNMSASVRMVVLGGETTLPSDVDRYKSLCSDDCLLVNGLGPTESTVTMQQFIGKQTVTRLNIPVGHSVEATNVFILDEHHQVADIYQEGMLVYESEFITPGYWNDPERTNQVILTGLFDPEKRYYLSGDMARRLPGGNIEFLGRNDNQVKIRGFRIELGEIESQLASYPEVGAAVVVAHVKRQENLLVAYYSSSENIAEQDLKDYLRQKLPDYMVPVMFIQLEELPLNRNGKVDYDALPKPELDHIQNFVAPVNQTEKQLVGIWSEVLQIPEDQISTTSNFFDLGGHSLKASLVANQVLKKLHVEIPLKNLFTYQDIQHLAEYINTLNKSQFIEISKAPEQESYPLTSAQHRLYFLYEFDQQTVAYNLPYVLRLRGPLNIARLETAFAALVDRHESLRTQFIQENEQVRQRILDPSDVNFKIQQYEENDLEKCEELVRLFISPFDLSQAPLFRVATVKTAAEEYLLLTDLHHIITDGTSQAILIKDFIDLYEGRTLAHLNIHYKDYAHWRATQTDSINDQKAYWVERFSDEIPTLDLPGDLILNNDNLTQGEHFAFELTAEETQEIHQFIGEQKGTTLFSFLMASFQVLLSRLTHQEDIIIGSPVVNRSHADTEKIIGLFLNTLPFRNWPKHEKTFAQFLGEVQQSALEAFDHQEYQFEDLISELNLKRDLKRNPLFDVFFNLLNFDQDLSFGLSDLTIESVDSDLKPGAKFFLTIHAKEIGGQVLFSCLYKSGFFQLETIKYIFGEYKKLLRQLVLDPETCIGDYQIFSQEVLSPTLRQPVPHKPFLRIEAREIEQTLIDRFQSIAQSFPNRIALKDARSEITYHELDLNTNRVANAVMQLETTDHDEFAPRAILLFGHNIQMIEGLWGALKASHAYVPISVDHPIERMLHIIRDSCAKVILTENEHLALAEEVIKGLDYPVQLINVQALGDQGNTKPPAITTKPNDLAYILYTSGSTGKPKGVMQIHRNVLHFWQVYTNALHIDQHDVLTMISNYAHDAAAMSFFGTLLNGATGVLYDLKSRGLELLDQVIRDHQVTIYHSTPSVFRAFTSIISEKASDSVRVVVMGGEAPFPNDVERYKSLFNGDCLMINGLGPTESTITVQNFINKQTIIRPNIPVGYPVEETKVFILDEHHEVADVYQKGVLVYESDFLTPGYWKDPEKTREAILDDLIEPGKRYYLSGDIARRLPNGQIEFLGRNDHQIKIRGYRVELGEIESQLTAHPDVKAAVVVPFEKQQDKLLVVYYALKESSLEVDLKNFLLQNLPDYMVPSIFLQLDELPLNQNGKVDHKVLPPPEIDIHQEFIEPANDTEEKLVAIWSDVLQLPKEQISTSSNFFELGGHSLLAMHMMHLILKELSIEIDLKMLFQYPTIQLLSEAFKIHFGQEEELDEEDYDTIYL